MGLDFYVKANRKTVIDENITHNLTDMWDAVGIYEVLYNSENKKVKDILPTLKEGLSKLVNNPEKFKKFNSPNGWGTYKDAIPWLENLITQLEKYPNGRILIDK